MVFVLRVFPVAEGGKAAGKLAFLRFQQIRGMNLLGDILAVHLVEDVLERGDVIAFPHGVDAVVHGDVPHTVTREEVLDEVAGLQIIAAQSRQIFRYNDIDLFAFDGFQHPLQRGSLHIQPCIAVVLVNFHDLPSLLFAVGFQHGPLRVDLSRVNSAKCSKLINCYLSLFINNKGLPIDTVAPSACRETRFIVQSWTGFLAYNSQIRIM